MNPERAQSASAGGNPAGFYGLVPAFRLDDAGALFAWALPQGDRALHLRRNVDVLDLDRIDLDAPPSLRCQEIGQSPVDPDAILQRLIAVSRA